MEISESPTSAAKPKGKIPKKKSNKSLGGEGAALAIHVASSSSAAVTSAPSTPHLADQSKTKAQPSKVKVKSAVSAKKKQSNGTTPSGSTTSPKKKAKKVCLFVA
jgi:hypothetical protein